MKKSVFRIAVTAGILMSEFTLTGCKNPVLEKNRSSERSNIKPKHNGYRNTK